MAKVPYLQTSQNNGMNKPHFWVYTYIQAHLRADT